jgi:hypothetical protein
MQAEFAGEAAPERLDCTERDLKSAQVRSGIAVAAENRITPEPCWIM